MTMLFSEVLRVRSDPASPQYDILVSFNETRGASVSRLDIEILPLIVHTPIGGRIFARPCPRPTSRLSFDLEISHSTQDARFATRRDVLLPDYLYSSGLGSYIFSKLIAWGQPIAPDFVFQRLSLSEVDARTDEAKQRRNGFYRAHGFQLDFSQDPAEENGRCLAAPLSTLKAREINPEKILSVLPIDQFIHSQLEENRTSQQDLASQKAETAIWQAIVEGYKRRNKRLKLLIVALILLLPHATVTAARVTTEGKNPRQTTLACKGTVPCDAESALAQCNQANQGKRAVYKAGEVDSNDFLFSLLSRKLIMGTAGA
jgi:hypothetical protein